MHIGAEICFSLPIFIRRQPEITLIMSITYHIRIKKDYAASLIEDLEKIDAIDLVKESDADFVVTRAQMNEVNARIKKYQDNPELLVDEDAVFKMLDA